MCTTVIQTAWSAGYGYKRARANGVGSSATFSGLPRPGSGHYQKSPEFMTEISETWSHWVNERVSVSVSVNVSMYVYMQTQRTHRYKYTHTYTNNHIQKDPHKPI